MSLLSRRLLLVLFTLVFIIGGSIIVLYGLGWRLNLENFQIQKTGAIAIQTTPRGVVIKLDNKEFSDDSNIIQNHTLIPNLLPKTYTVTIEKEGFQKYRKILKLKPSLVETINAFLPPNKFKSETLAKSIKGNVIIDVSTDSNKIISLNSLSGNFYLYDLKNPKTALNLGVLAANILSENTTALEIKKVGFLPFDSNRIIIETKNGLIILDTERRQKESLIEEKILSWNIRGSTVYFVKTKKGDKNIVSFLSYNLVFKTQNTLFEITSSTAKFPVKSVEASRSGNRIAFLDSGGGLYLFTEKNPLPEKIAHSVKFFEFSPNNRAIAFLDTNGTINVRFIDEWDEIFRKKIGDVSRFELAKKQELEKIFWYKDSLRLLAGKSNEVSLTEIDDRPPLNLYNIENGFDNLFYDGENNFIYILRQGQFQKVSLES
ncbi:MAG: hypothetical protein NUV83_02930 [Candidatus Wolfebacteria bacterium]|nr:hypothetical protein [Candidatus Wolfebacteria bacterium]